MAQNKCERRSLSFDATSLVASGQRRCPSAMKDYCQSLDVREDFDLFTAFVFSERADRMWIMDLLRSCHLSKSTDTLY